MAAKKNKRSTRATTSDAHTIVLEDLRSQFLVFGEALQGLREHMDARFATVDHELGLVKHELGLVKAVVLDHDGQLRSLREEVTAVRDDVGVLRRDVELLKVAVLDNVREIKELRKVQ